MSGNNLSTVVVNRTWDGQKVIEVAAGRSVIYVGRGSPYGNPYSVEEYGREEALRLYGDHLDMEVGNNSIFRQKVRDLAGKALACWCAPLLCHGNLLAAEAERLRDEEQRPSSAWVEVARDPPA